MWVVGVGLSPWAETDREAETEVDEDAETEVDEETEVEKATETEVEKETETEVEKEAETEVETEVEVEIEKKVAVKKEVLNSIPSKHSTKPFVNEQVVPKGPARRWVIYKFIEIAMFGLTRAGKTYNTKDYPGTRNHPLDM